MGAGAAAALLVGRECEASAGVCRPRAVCWLAAHCGSTEAHPPTAFGPSLFQDKVYMSYIQATQVSGLLAGLQPASQGAGGPGTALGQAPPLCSLNANRPAELNESCAQGGGGWPMSCFLTPSLEPFFGGALWPCCAVLCVLCCAGSAELGLGLGLGPRQRCRDCRPSWLAATRTHPHARPHLPSPPAAQAPTSRPATPTAAPASRRCCAALQRCGRRCGAVWSSGGQCQCGQAGERACTCGTRRTGLPLLQHSTHTMRPPACRCGRSRRRR